MPKNAARILAFDTAVANEELEAAISYLEQKLNDASFGTNRCLSSLIGTG